jgi:iturin family lipopeptide synthetase A
MCCLLTQLAATCSVQQVELYLAMLAVMKAGGCYVPVDHTLPAARVESILEQASCHLMLTQEGVDALPALQNVHKVLLSSDWQQFRQQPSANPIGRCGVRNPAYILFTSGKALQDVTC